MLLDAYHRQADATDFLGMPSSRARAKVPLELWFNTVQKAEWSAPADVKRSYGDASILKNGRVVFTIGGNKYRLVALINYEYRIVYVRFIGTHSEYDDVDAESI